jgi:hypothetical protein
MGGGGGKLPPSLTKLRHGCTQALDWSPLGSQSLGFILTPNGIKPQQKIVQAILQITPPIHVKNAHHFVGMLNQYKQMFLQCSHLLTPTVQLTQKSAKLCCQLKALLMKQISFVYPDYSRPFHIYTNTSKYQLGE